MEIIAKHVPDDLGGVRLDVAVAHLCPSLSRAAAQRLIREGNVLLNDSPSKPSQSVAPGDELRVTVPPAVEPEARPQEIPLDIVYEDGDLVLVNKPSGMVVHPGAGNPDESIYNQGADAIRPGLRRNPNGPFRGGVDDLDH